MSATHDAGPESAAAYESDMKEYVDGGNPEVERNILLMKKWSSAGQ
jgi:hypothetical protein